MSTDFRSAIGQAMARLKASDVAGATAAIQRALARNPGEPQQGGSEDSPPAAAGFKARISRGLSETLQSLRSEQARYAPQARAAPRPAVNPRDEDPRFTSRQLGTGAGALTYKLYVPDDHAGRDLALLVMLHGCTQDPDDFARGTRMNALADEFGLVVAYPHQPRSANAQGCWNWFDPRHQKRDAGEPAALAGLAQHLAAEFGVDRKRVFVAGLSAGGAMADILSSTYPEVFAAAGIHSGLPHGAAQDVMSAFAAMKKSPRRATPRRGDATRRIIFHGTADATVHPSNGDALFDRALAHDDRPTEFMTDTLINGRQVVRRSVVPANAVAETEYWVIQGAGHAWSGGDGGGSYTDTTGPDASREMIRFFLRH